MAQLPPEVQNLIARANAAIQNNSVQSYIQELREGFTPEQNVAVQNQAERITRSIPPQPFTGTPHRLNES